MKYSYDVLVGLFAVLRLTSAIPLTTAAIKRQSSELRESYDFVIAGAGTSGLTVADRLTEAFPDKHVLVVEYGEVQYAPGVFDPPETMNGQLGGLASRWTLSSTPSPELNNNTAAVVAGKAVGGSSAVNGMFFDRGSRFDYDAWDKLQGDRHEDEEGRVEWDWNAVYPFFKKSVTFTPPPEAVALQHNYTWEASAFDNTTPIHASFPAFLWGDHVVARKAWEEMGIRITNKCYSGDKEGLCWITTSQHPVTARRSHSGLGHYADVVGSRPNYHLLVKHQVTRVLYPRRDPASGPPLVEVRSVDGQSSFNITATDEVVLSAGVFGSPAILQRSGIGPAAFLQSANITVVLDLPGVGSNLHDHSGPRIYWNYTEPLPFSPLESDMLNGTFAAAAAAAFNETPAQGPYTVAMSNSAIWVPLPNITANYTPIIDEIRRMATTKELSSLHLPPAYNLDPTLLAGYRAQLLAVADMLADPRSPSLESAFTTGTRASCINLHPLSRGTVRLNLADPLDVPILDYRSASNPIDLAVHLAHLKYMMRMVQTPTMQGLSAVLVAPAPGVESDEELLAYVRETTVQSFMHPCCTAAMMPLESGGVVGTDLRVHGAKGLRVVDASVFPILPAAHLSGTAYALGEKAADIIIRDWSEREGTD
ncbi:Glucose-methanol-choline oxidoreductase N-terminal domain-containing protein [Madurella fahalii]|uniref:Glucose-methanol-choline oxidoreductase N-terminal domain-containing protein n=1 Tax=Madurella fahalii TaxID=1157608 RepID=A0ABQ0FZ08_9PEZI